MTDSELLELAAKAAGLNLEFLNHANGLETVIARYPEPNDKMADGYLWNPLEDDGAALRLAAILHMMVNIGALETIAYYSKGLARGSIVDRDTRRAIVRAAAEIGRAMP